MYFKKHGLNETLKIHLPPVFMLPLFHVLFSIAPCASLRDDPWIY